ncbi:hypothetical protein Tco_1479029 [Tanacetum coccineum]
MCPHALTATTSAPTRDIQKRYQKVKTAEAGIGNQDQRRRNQVGRRMTYPSHGVGVHAISTFVHGIINLELIKRLHDKIPKTLDEMMRVTTSFLRGEVAASNHERKKLFPPWKHQEGNQKQNSRKDGSGTSRGQKGSKIDSRSSQKLPKKFSL